MTVRFESVQAKRVQADEIWAFVGMKQKHASPEERLMGMGDAWTYYALGPDSKLIIAYRAGTRGPPRLSSPT